ncbi:hydantoinase/oxoprolinase family protein, partial [Thioclava sp. BHET1]
ADPRDFALFAFGGAGPLHATAIARELGVPRVLVPARPGITNALGCVVADLRHDYVSTINRPLDTLDMDHLATVLQAQAEEGEALIRAEKIEIISLQKSFSVDMQFMGQTHLLRVPLDGPEITREALRARFEEAYHRRFRVQLDQIRASVVNANCSVIGTRADFDLSQLIDPAKRRATLAEAQTGSRPVCFAGQWHDTPLYRREFLPRDAQFTGPAIVEQMDTTVLIEPGDHVTSDADGNLIITLGGRA